MIKPWQKLSEGDFFLGGTIEQYEELLAIEGVNTNPNYANHCVSNKGIICGYGFDLNEGLFYIGEFRNKLKQEYDFPDFKQLCENTFVG